ncbi:transposase [Thermocatellispora tengchongensis]|uniref:transposase n=1 Tax=Thermocatellispora tengchongensis TaxID=1073253 RepID=UPI0036441C63
MAGTTRRRFDPEFQARAVRIVKETGKPVSHVARALGVNEYTLHNRVQMGPRGHGVDDQHDECSPRTRAGVRLVVAAADRFAGGHGEEPATGGVERLALVGERPQRERRRAMVVQDASGGRVVHHHAAVAHLRRRSHEQGDDPAVGGEHDLERRVLPRGAGTDHISFTFVRSISLTRCGDSTMSSRVPVRSKPVPVMNSSDVTGNRAPHGGRAGPGA